MPVVVDRPGRLVALALLLVLSLPGCGQVPAGSQDPPEAAASRSPVPDASSPAATAGSRSATPSAGGSPSATTGARTTPSPRPITLPRGGTEVFPRYRLVGYAGLTGASTLGRLGTGDLDQRLAELEERAKPYGTGGREVLPVAEVITTIVQAAPGRDGRYRSRLSDAQLKRYLTAVRQRKGLLLLAIQPGRSDFLTEVQAYEKWLKQPDVGVALDPEWAMGPGQRPGRVFGHTTGKELTTVADYLADLVEEHHLPEKVMVVHELAPRIIRSESGWKKRAGVVAIKSVDGIGTRADKEATYRAVWKGTPSFVEPGFKLFYDEDRDHGTLMSPKQVLALKPRPAYVMYE